MPSPFRASPSRRCTRARAIPAPRSRSTPAPATRSLAEARATTPRRIASRTWTARTLWHWRRDELLATEAPTSPCVMNIIDPADVALGERLVQTGTELLTAALAQGTACAAAPSSEPVPPPR